MSQAGKVRWLTCSNFSDEAMVRKGCDTPPLCSTKGAEARFVDSLKWRRAGCIVGLPTNWVSVVQDLGRDHANIWLSKRSFRILRHWGYSVQFALPPRDADNRWQKCSARKSQVCKWTLEKWEACMILPLVTRILVQFQIFWYCVHSNEAIFMH